ncbi:hypothetical protein D3C76_864990 [compost metagenome]
MHLFIGDGTALLVDDFLAHADRYDFIGEQARCLGRCGALLGLQAVNVLGFTTDVVAPGDNFSGLQHRHVGMLGHAQHIGILFGGGELRVRVLHQADLLLAGTDGDLHAIDHDLFGGNRDRHQTRRALTVDGLAADRQWQAGRQSRQARQVGRRGTALHGRAHHQVVDFTRFDARTLDGGTNGQRAHRRRFEIIERTAKGFGDRRAGSGNDNGVLHGSALQR